MYLCTCMYAVAITDRLVILTVNLQPSQFLITSLSKYAHLFLVTVVNAISPAVNLRTSS